MEKKLSKYWNDQEIKGIAHINGRKVIYLKSHVKRLYRFNDHLLESYMQHINYSVLALSKYQEYMRTIIGKEEFGRYQ